MSPDESDGTDLVIAITKNGDARWKVVTRYTLESKNDTAAFEQLVSDLRAGEANATMDERTFRSVAQQSSTATDREMAIRNVTYTGSVDEDNETGTLTMAFTWKNFAEERDGQLHVGDAFRSPGGGTWLPRIVADQTLTIRMPPGYHIDESDFRARQENRSLIVDGPREFESGTIRVTYAESNLPEIRGGVAPELLAGIGLVVALIVAGVWLLQRQDGDEPWSRDGDALAVRSSEADDRDETGGDERESMDEVPSNDEDAVDLSLLSDEERVEHILERNGGRMRQANIVAETGWSDAKVSQLLSSMADDGRVEKLRLGRENLISFPDWEDDSDDEGD
ncbi:helix-turn-helix transcriptional regulator [Halegenticoccus tardaugens]|uniref:helix-turn-helix transcriptional regulator n=1 Tax=Halegenticoccus tardaugens TaxID=2071624 RepID=UPI00100AF07C|nr:hypothetical protein [Halegenticoccus tardaugens]